MKRLVLNPKGHMASKKAVLKTRTMQLTSIGASKYIECSYWTKGGMKPKPDVIPDYEMEYTTAEGALSAAYPCPVCLEKFLAEHENYWYDELLNISHTNPVNRRHLIGRSEVTVLHWGHSGEYGICYTCAGFPKEMHPNW